MYDVNIMEKKLSVSMRKLSLRKVLLFALKIQPF
jgi:hypothetical protein